MKQRTLTRLSIFFCCCLMIFACRQEVENIIYGRKGVPSELLESAKIYYLQKIPARKFPNGFSPNWRDAWVSKTSDEKSVIIVPTSRYVANNEHSFNRLFVFTFKDNDIVKGEIIELLGKSYDIGDNVDFLVQHYNQALIPGFNGVIFFYEINYQPKKNAVYENGIQVNNRQAMLIVTANQQVEAQKRTLESIEHCPWIEPFITPPPSNICAGAEIIWLHEFVINEQSGCVVEYHISYIGHICPPEGSGSGSGSGSGGGENESEKTIVNQVDDPCLNAIVQTAIDNNVKGYLCSFIGQCATDFDLIFKETSSGSYVEPSTVAITVVGDVDPNYIVTIGLSEGSGLPGSSQEFIISTIYHSIARAISQVEGLGNIFNNPSFNSSYASMVKNKLMIQFPNLPPGDAEMLGWGCIVPSLAHHPSPTNYEQGILFTNQLYYQGDLGASLCIQD